LVNAVDQEVLHGHFPFIDKNSSPPGPLPSMLERGWVSNAGNRLERRGGGTIVPSLAEGRARTLCCDR
jgi:hypothetical protein